MAKHLTKAQLLYQIKHAAKQSKDCKRIAFHVVSVMCCYVMWKFEGWGQKRLTDYLKRAYEYYYGEEKIEEWNERLEEVAGFPVTFDYLTEADNRYKKTKPYRYLMEESLIESENMMMEIYKKFILIHFNVLIDMGWREKRICRNREYIECELIRMEKNELTEAFMTNELRTKVGVLFEAP